MRRFSPALALSFALALSAAPIPAPAAGPSAPGAGYAYVSPSPDGIGKTYMGREIARVMSWHGAAWLERPARTAEERTDLLLAALELRPGMVVSDIGAGSGFHAWRIAQAVGPAGKVYAVDIQPRMLDLLREQVARRGVANVQPVLGRPQDPALPEGALDLALMVDVYHEFEYPHEMLVAIVRALKPGGRLVFVEFKGEDPGVPIKALHKMTLAQVRREAAAHALEWERTVTALPWQHAVVFRRRE